MNSIYLPDLINKLNELKPKTIINGYITTNITIEQLLVIIKELKIKELTEELNKITN